MPTPRRPRKRQAPAPDPVLAIFDAGHLVRRGHEQDALYQLLVTATRKALPREWSRELKTRAKQLRRVVSFRAHTDESIAAGRLVDARAKLRIAKDALEKASQPLAVEFRGPTVLGPLDLWHLIVASEKRQLSNTSGRLRMAEDEELTRG